MTSEGKLKLYPGNGSDDIVGPYPEFGSGFQNLTALIAPGDWNGDGDPDLIGRNSAGALLLYGGTGNGFVQSPVQIGTGFASMTAFIAPGDFNGDGNPDLIVRHTNGSLQLFPGNGAGGLQLQPPDNWHRVLVIHRPIRHRRLRRRRRRRHPRQTGLERSADGVHWKRYGWILWRAVWHRRDRLWLDHQVHLTPDGRYVPRDRNVATILRTDPANPRSLMSLRFENLERPVDRTVEDDLALADHDAA